LRKRLDEGRARFSGKHVSEDQFGRLSAEQREIVHAALATAFGAAAVVEVAPVTGGISAFAFRVRTGGRNYLLRIEGPASPLRNPHQYASMQMAAEAGIAPKISYLNEAGRVVIMDFVDKQPLRAYPGGEAGLARALGSLLAQLQATRTFPYFVEYPDIVTRLFAYVPRRDCSHPVCSIPMSSGWSRCVQNTSPARRSCSQATTISIRATSFLMASACGWSIGNLPTATILLSILRS
jgi:hypothetical protein